jgi:hypothetical protein
VPTLQFTFVVYCKKLSVSICIQRLHLELRPIMNCRMRNDSRIHIEREAGHYRFQDYQIMESLVSGWMVTAQNRIRLSVISLHFISKLTRIEPEKEIFDNNLSHLRRF